MDKTGQQFYIGKKMKPITISFTKRFRLITRETFYQKSTLNGSHTDLNEKINPFYFYLNNNFDPIKKNN